MGIFDLGLNLLMKPIYKVLLFIVIVPIVVFALLLMDMYRMRGKDYTHLDSKEIEDRLVRVEKLKMIVDLPSDIYDTKFKLFDVNGFGEARSYEIPGPSSWNYVYAVKVDSNDIAKWVEGQSKPIDSSDYETIKSFLDMDNTWKLKSTPEYYEVNSKENVFVFRHESIIIKTCNNL